MTADWLAKRLMEDDDRVQLETELRCVPKHDPPPPVKPVCLDTRLCCIPRETSLVLDNDVPVGIITPVDLLHTVG